MKTLYNNCVKCGARWQVVGSQSSLSWEDISLDQTDVENLQKHKQLFSICEDCDNHGECISVNKE